MPPKRSRAQGTGETSNTESTAQGSENPNLTTTQIAQLVAATVEQILANQPESHPPPDRQIEEIRKLQEEIARLREERNTGPTPPPAREVPFSPEVLAAELPQHFKFPNVGEYDGMGDLGEHLSRFGKIRKLQEEIARLREERNTGPTPPPAREVPFSPEVLAAELPQHFKFPNVGEYDGMGDLGEHLSRFGNAALLHQYADPIKCRVFLTTLVRSAQQWFNILQTGSIKSFQDFSQAFLHQFANSKKQPMTTLNLFTVKQKENESLRKYIGRFNRTIIEVPSATPDLIIRAFTQGLRGGDFFRSLVKKPLKTFDDLLTKAKNYVNVEEIQPSRRSEHREPSCPGRKLRIERATPRPSR
ncbi:hypothetical protein F511_26803 [Dorcoceras hygrometricum]|uniref:Retrotransposon gag domain-containing protein n=1 Tax=Dorcoceras hygrometricum TaxID=472368 RepID=A0A2Z7D7X0_9LAMI|nr:hypothetical protein F511_26803 [Dorcoceras hygrometricum]